MHEGISVKVKFYCSYIIFPAITRSSKLPSSKRCLYSRVLLVFVFSITLRRCFFECFVPFLLSALRAIKHVSFQRFGGREPFERSWPRWKRLFLRTKERNYVSDNYHGESHETSVEWRSNSIIRASCINKELEFINLPSFLYNRGRAFESCLVHSIIPDHLYFPKI